MTDKNKTDSTTWHFPKGEDFVWRFPKAEDFEPKATTPATNTQPTTPAEAPTAPQSNLSIVRAMSGFGFHS